MYDVAERHHTLVRATPATVYSALREADMASGLLPRVLLALRALPGAILTPRATRRERKVAHAAEGTSAARLANFERRGFRLIAERAPEELVIGVLGRFWTATGVLNPAVSRDDFIAGPPRGWALAGWNFRVIPRDALLTELRTETRVWCAPDALLKFRAYWMLVRPGSGLIRRAMLKSVRRYAEARTA